MNKKLTLCIFRWFYAAGFVCYGAAFLFAAVNWPRLYLGCAFLGLALHVSVSASYLLTDTRRYMDDGHHKNRIKERDPVSS